jgi:hypothetical protein
MLNPQELAFLQPVVLSYLDGGSGSIVFQVALSGLLAVGYVYRSAWTGIRTRLRKIGRKDSV